MARFKILDNGPVNDRTRYIAKCVHGETDTPITVAVTGEALAYFKAAFTPGDTEIVGLAIDVAEEEGWPENEEVLVEMGSPIEHHMTMRVRGQEKSMASPR